MEYKLPPLPKNLPNVVRRLRACEGEVAAQVVFEHALNEYAIAAIEAQGVSENRCITELKAYAEANPGTYIFPRWDGQRVAKYLASAPPAPQAKPQPLSSDRDARIAELERELSEARQSLRFTGMV